MRRYGSTAFHTEIEAVFARLPTSIVQRIEHVEFLCGVDPVFAGLHGYTKISDGRSFRDTAHFCASHHLLGALPDRRPTIVLPTLRAARFWTVHHELGHALHDTLGDIGEVEPITEYAQMNVHEAFAEAFCAWRWPAYCGKDLRAVDPRVNELFEQLAA